MSTDVKKTQRPEVETSIAGRSRSDNLSVLIVTSQLPNGKNSIDMAPLSRQIESLRKAGLQVDVLEVIGFPILKYAQTIPELRRRAANADIVHAHYGLCGWIARFQFQRPLIVSFMGDDLLGTPKSDGRLELPSKLIACSGRWLAKFVDAVIVKSDEMANVLSTVPARVIPNGVDMDRFRPTDSLEARAKLRLPTHKKLILFPGNPNCPRKGHPLARAAVERLRKRLVDEVEIISLWNVRPNDVPDYMNACNAMVMTSWIEGSPNVVKEAMACNLPVISVKVGDTNELLANLSDCRIVDRNPNRMADALADILRSEPEPAGRAALIRKKLDLTSVASRIISIYEDVLRRRAA